MFLFLVFNKNDNIKRTLGNEYSFFIFDFLLNLNKIAIFYIESGEKPKFIWALKYNTNKYTLCLIFDPLQN